MSSVAATPGSVRRSRNTLSAAPAARSTRSAPITSVDGPSAGAAVAVTSTASWKTRSGWSAISSVLPRPASPAGRTSGRYPGAETSTDGPSVDRSRNRPFSSVRSQASPARTVAPATAPPVVASVTVPWTCPSSA